MAKINIIFIQLRMLCVQRLKNIYKNKKESKPTKKSIKKD